MFDIDHLYLASYNYGKINETVVTGGDNFEVTVGLSKTEGLTEEQLEQNGLLDCMMTLLKDVENSINCLYRSIDNDTDLAQSLSKQLPISESNKHLAYNFGTLHEQVERRNDYINGKKGIGPFALNVTNQMLTYLFGVKFKDTKFTKFTGIWRLDHLVDDNDAYISSWLSAFINANVDIVKDPWVVRLNVNPFTYNILNLLVRSGMGQTGVWFLCQPIIRELASVEERTKSNFSKDPSLPKYKFKQKLIGEVLDKYFIEHDDATISEYTTNSDAQSIQSRIDVVNLILDNKEALRYIAVNPNATMVKLNDGSDVSVSWFQGQIYYAFLSLQKYIQAMNKLVQYTKIDTRKHGKNFIQIQRYLAMYNELFHPQDTSKSLWDLESLTNLANNSWIEYKTVNAINLPLRILANQVYTANSDFSSVVLHFARRLARSASDEYGFTEDLIKKINNGLQTAIKARYMSAYAKQVLGRSDEYIRELFYGSSPLISIARRLNGLKYAIESVSEFERLKGNYIIEKLRPQPQQESVALSDGSVARQPQFITIDSNIDGSRTNENMMIDAWKDLLNDPNERVRMFAEDLILYTFFTTGESKGWNKLFKYVPSAWIRGEIRGGTVDVDGIQCTSFSDYVEQTLNGRMPDLIPMLQEVVSNNFLNYGMCTTMQLKNEDGTTNFINPDASSPVLVANAISESDIDSMPLYISVKKPNTKGRKAGSYNVYKMTGEINATNGVYPIYTMIEKRGYSQFNNDIYEYGIDLQYKENETKIPNASAEEIESRISDACEKIENTGKQGHKWTWDEILIDLTGAFYGESVNDDVATDEQNSVPSEPDMTQQSESQPSQATSGIKYESDGGVSVEYTPTGKQKQTYTVKGNKIFNKNGDEVFKEDSVDRNKIFANLAVLQGRAVVVEHKGIKYVVNNRNQIISGATGKIMQWGEENGDRNAIIQAAEKRFKEKDVKAAMEKSVHEAHKDVLNTLGGDEQAESEINSAVKTAVAGVALNEVLDKIESVFTKEERAQITAATKDGKLQVMSVSRMTDPIFFTKEIIKFLEENSKKPFTDPTRVNAIEIWSKHDGMPMQDLLRACKKYKVAPMVSFSITGLGDTTLERGVMKYNDLIDRIEKLVQSGDLNPNTTTIRIDPILVGETNFEDVKTIVNRCKQIGIKKFVTSLVQSYGYLDGTTRDRKVVSGINEAMQRDGRTYDWDKYYGRVTNQDYAASKDFVQQYQNQHPKASWSEIVSAGAAQGVRVVTQSSIGKIHFIPKQEYIDEIGKILLEINKDPEIELETCSFFIKGLRASACLDPLIIERITGVDVTDENGRYNRDTSRPDCMCYGAHSDIFRMNEKRCFSSCAYCYAGKSDSNAISYYNEDGTLKDTIYTRTYEAEESGVQKSINTNDYQPSYNSEEQSIIDKAKKDGTFMMAPNGKPTNLTERQWVRARTKAFKDQFGDWEKEYTPQTNIYKENPWEKYMETEDTGRTYIGHSGKTIPIIINKGIKYVHPVERIATTDKDPFGFNSYNVNNLIIVGKEVDADRNFNGICQVTARACKDFLKNRYNIESSVVIIKAKSPVKDGIIDHWVNVLSINGEAYIYDMPQTEYIKQTKPLVYDGKILDGYYEGVIVSKYTPRLIKVTEENLSKFYEDNNENDKQIKVIKSTIKQLNKDGESVDLNNLQYKPAYDKNVSKAVDENGEPLQQELIKQYPELAEVSRSGRFTWARTSDNSYEVSTLASKNKMSKQEGDARFSALNAKFKDGTIIDGIDVGGMTIEDVYQKVIKKSGKGKAPSKDSKLYRTSVSSYTGDITPDANTIFVFGSNPEGRHGAGAAKIAREQFGAIYGQGEGLQGNAYALPTKDLRVTENRGLRSISESQIIENIKKLYETARQNPYKQFKVAYRNTDRASLNGYTGLEMIDMFLKAGSIPTNIVFSKEWVDTGKFNLSREELEDFSYTEGYLPLWQEWARQNPELIEELRINANGKTLTDQFAGTKERPGRVSQARALADILNSRSQSNAQKSINTKQIEDSGLNKQSATQPIKTEKTPKNYQKYIDVIQKYFDIGYTTGRIGKNDAKQVIQKLHIHIDENSELFDAMKDNNLSETDLLNALYLLASHLDKPEVKGRTKLSDQQIDKLLDDMKNGNILTDVLDMTGGIYRIHESNDGLIIDTQLMSDLDFLLQNKKYEPIYRQLLNYMMNNKYMDEYYGDIVDIFNIDHEDLSGLIQVDSTFDNVNQLELFSDKDFEEGMKIKNNCKGK